MTAIRSQHYAIVVVLALVLGCDRAVQVKVTKEPVMYDRSPLIRLADKASFQEFEAAVTSHPEWINQKSKVIPHDRGALAACAIMARTNHVRILIQHGADVQEALAWFEQENWEEPAQLITRVQAEPRPVPEQEGR